MLIHTRANSSNHLCECRFTFVQTFPNIRANEPSKGAEGRNISCQKEYLCNYEKGRLCAH